MVTMRNLLDLILISMFISMCYCDTFITEANKRIISGIQIHRDEKLCDINGGLGPSKLLNQRCLIKAADESCKFFPLVKNLTNCEQASVQLKEYSHSELLSTIENIDTDPSIRRIVISIKNSSSLDPSTLGNSLDSFLTPRPWWHVIREPFNWQKHLKKEVVLERLGTDWEPYFRYLTTFHFPVQEVCRKSTLLVGRAACVHPGWFSALSFYRMTFSAHPYAITVSYYPELVDRPNNNAWVSFKDCPANMNNTWTCAFLTTTNCSIPKYVTDCNNDKCNNEQNMNNMLYMDKADIDGNMLDKNAVGSSGKSPPFSLNPAAAAISTGLPSAYVARPYNQSYVLENYRKINVLNAIDLTSVVYIHKFLTRPNHFYRSRIAYLIHKFRAASTPHFNSSARCVAAQLRRGDRAIPEHIDPDEWCYNASHKLPCNGGYCNPDMGCSEHGGLMFASVNLSHVIEKAAMLVGPDVKNLVVASDDPAWVERQIAKMKILSPEWNIYTLPPPRQRETKQRGDEPIPGYHFMRSEGGTESGTFLFASMELATQCEGFVGHLGSGGTMMFHQYMCLHHAGLRGVCPPTYDMRTGLWLK